MRTVQTLIALAALLPGIIQVSAAENLPVPETAWAVGTARSAETGELLYREYHYRQGRDSALPEKVLYLGPDQSLLAEKQLDTAYSAIAPDFVQIDHRFQRRLEVRRLDDSEATVSFRKNSQEQIRVENMALSGDLVIDAGFDAFIRSHWQALTSDQTVRAEFLLPSRFDTVKVRISAEQMSACQDGEAGTEGLCLVIKPGGLLRLAGWFIDPLKLVYERDSRRIQKFVGPGNLTDEDGEPQEVEISYQYRQDE